MSIEDLHGEKWEMIPGYEGIYSASNMGRIKSLKRTVKDTSGRTRTINERVKGFSIGYGGYPVVSLCKDSKTRTFLVHRIIASLFIPNPDCKPCIDHINRDTKDNRLSNLRWVTQKENVNNPNTIEYCRSNVNKKQLSLIANETKRAKGTKTAPKNVFQYSLSGEFVAEYESLRDAEQKTGISRTGIGQVVDKSEYTMGGFVWSSTRQTGYKHTPKVHPFYTPVQQFSPEGDLIGEWVSLTKAAKALGVSRKYIERRVSTGEFRLLK